MKSLTTDRSGDILNGILSQHTHIVPAEGYSNLTSEYDRSHEIIALQMDDLHGGTIDADFPDDGGSRFVVRLPRTWTVVTET